MATATCTCGKINWVDTGFGGRCAKCRLPLRKGAAPAPVAVSAAPRCTRCGTARHVTTRPCRGCGWDADAQVRKCRDCAGPLETWSPLAGGISRLAVVGISAALLGILGLRVGAPVALGLGAAWGLAGAATTRVRCGRCALPAPRGLAPDRSAGVRRIRAAAVALLCGGLAAAWPLLRQFEA